MQFVLIFLLCVGALFVCTLGNGLGALCMLALALTLVIFCVKARQDRLASIDRKLDALLTVCSALKPDEKEEKDENG